MRYPACSTPWLRRVAGRKTCAMSYRPTSTSTMPAVLVEVAFISNPEEEKLLASPEFQHRVARALMRGIARYRTERAQRTGLVTGPGERDTGHAR